MSYLSIQLYAALRETDPRMDKSVAAQLADALADRVVENHRRGAQFAYEGDAITTDQEATWAQSSGFR